MEEIQEHVPGRRLLTQEQLHRVRRTLPRRLQRQIAQPLGQRFPSRSAAVSTSRSSSGVIRVATVLVR